MINTLLSLLKAIIKLFANPFSYVTFSPRVIDKSGKKTEVYGQLKIYNLSKQMIYAQLDENKNLDIEIPIKSCFDKYNWASSEDIFEKRTLKNSWVNLYPYSKGKYVTIDFKINTRDSKSWIKFYDYKSRRSIKVYFKYKNGWKAKIGKFNFYHDPIRN